MAQVNAGRVRFIGRGEYDNSTQYYTFDLVDYNGNSYFAKANTTGNVPTNTTYWQLVAEKGNTGNTGPTGPTGNGIASIIKTSTSGLVDTYTITFTNGQTTTYQITNGANGSVVDVQVDGTSVVDNGIANIVGISEIKQELEDMYNLLPKVQGTGETITLNNTVAGKMLVDLKGNTSQETTTGKNKLPILEYSGKTSNSMTTSCNGVDYTINGTLSGTWFDLNSWTNATIPAGRYLLSWESSIIPRLTFVVKYSDESIASFYISGGRNYVVVNLTQNVISYRLFSDGLTNGQTYNGTIKKLLLEAKESGEDRGDYEPYTNGASPNPDYPQDIQVVSGDNTITISNSDNTQSQSYSINLGDIELCKIGDYQDIIIKDNGKWYLNKQINKVVLNGSENWSYTNNTFLISEIENYKNKDENICLSNFYTTQNNVTATSQVLDNHLTFRYDTSEFATKGLYIKNGNITSASAFKTWLSNNNVTLYYVLAIPTYTEITDNTLISQLEAVKRSFNGQTNISQENDDKPFILDVTALKELTTEEI